MSFGVISALIKLKDWLHPYEHDGFDLSDPYQGASRRILGHGWPTMPGRIGTLLSEG